MGKLGVMSGNNGKLVDFGGTHGKLRFMSGEEGSQDILLQIKTNSIDT